MDFSAKTSRQRRVVGSGLIALDVLLEGGKAAAYQGLGGSAGNVLAILAYLGWASFPVARLGHDAAAKRIEHEFQQLGAATHFLKADPDSCTPVVYQWTEGADGMPFYSFRCPVCGQRRGFDDHADTSLVDAVVEQMRGPAVFFFDRATEATATLAEHFRRNRGMVVFEPSVVGDAEEFNRCVNASHVVKYSVDRIGSLNEADLSGVLVEIQTMGREGLKYRLPRNSHEWTDMPAIDAPFVADTSGAGDWCTAGALYWFLREGRSEAGLQATAQGVGTALRFGQALATLNCMYKGARGASRNLPAEELLRAAERVSAGDMDSQCESPISMLDSIRAATSSVPTSSAANLCCEKLAF